MIDIAQHRTKILASHFAAMMETHRESDKLEAFVCHNKDEYQLLKQWWDDMDALRVLRAAEHHIRNLTPKVESSSNPIEKVAVIEDGIVKFMGEPIGKIYSYYRTVLPQEMQIKIAYNSLIDRFWKFVQQEKCAIRLSENDFAVQIFVPRTDPDTEFNLMSEWDKFIKFAYSETELYKSFTLLVNSLKLADRGFGYVRFPPATREMMYWLAAFYIATLRERILRNADNYKKANTALKKASDNLKKYQDQLRADNLTERRRTSIEIKFGDENEKLDDAVKARKSALKVNQEELGRILSELRHQTDTIHFDHAERLSYQFNRAGARQFLPTVKLKSQSEKSSIEDTIVEILHTPIAPLGCPFGSYDEMSKAVVREAGDDVKNLCYSCGRPLPPGKKHQQANRFVFQDPSQRLQSGGSQTQPKVCDECLTITFACSVKFTSGAIIVELAPNDRMDRSFSIENHLRMLTLGELNLVAGRYLLINCREFVREHGGLKPVSKKIGQVQYALWRVAQTLPTAALEEMHFTLYAGESKIPLPRRHLIWLSYLNESLKPRLIVNGKDNIRLCQAIRLIQKDEVISAIYTLVTAEFPQVTPIHNQSYSEKRSLEELREKHCDLLDPSLKGGKLMTKQGDFYRDVAALTGLTYAYCDYVRGELRKKEKPDTVQREVKKLIEKVVNPSFFNYEASGVLPGTRATMYCSDDNYFCYAEAKRLLEDTLKLDISDRKGHTDKGQESMAIFFDDILNAYAALSEKYDNKAQRRKLSYQLKLNLYAKFPFLLKKEINQNGN